MTQSLNAIVPMACVTAAGIAAMVAEAFRDPGERMPIAGLGAVGLIGAGVASLLLWNHNTSSFGVVVADNFGLFVTWILIIVGLLSLAFSGPTIERERLPAGEYYALMLFALAGMMLMATATDLLVIFLALEVLSLAVYVLTGIRRDSLASTEAALKYFLLGAFSSAFFLYGIAFTYGLAGSTRLERIGSLMAAQALAPTPMQLLALGLLLVGFAFKVSAVPFHMWTPDVYEGAPTPVTAFFAAAPKVAGIAMFVRTTIVAFPGLLAQWQQIVVFVAIASMALGAFAAIGQRNIKRLMAYSSIGNMGYALIGLAAGTADGVQGVLVYMAIYVAMTLGTFACIIAMRRPDGAVERISDLAGLARTKPGMAFWLAMMMFSLAGIPPLAGFFAKFYVFLASINAGLFVLAVIGVVTSVVGAYYYLTIVKIMYFDEPAKPFAPMAYELKVVLAVTGLFNILFFVYPGPLIAAATAAARSLF